jgi:hypothetical protein
MAIGNVFFSKGSTSGLKSDQEETKTAETEPKTAYTILK